MEVRVGGERVDGVRVQAGRCLREEGGDVKEGGIWGLLSTTVQSR